MATSEDVPETPEGSSPGQVVLMATPRSDDELGLISGNFEGLCAINNLPRELMVRIFHYFEPIEHTLPLLGCVCKKWHKLLLETPSLWRRLHVHPSRYESRHYAIVCAIFITYGHHIQELVWESGTRMCESIFCLIPSLSSLTVLNIPITWNRTVIETLSPLVHLEDVHINGGFELTDEDLALIGIQFPSLRKVALNSCWAVSQHGIAALLKSLEFLEDCSIKINIGLPVENARSDHAMLQGSVLIRSFGDLPRPEVVTSLLLNLVPVEMEDLWSAVMNLPQLKKLTVSNCEKLYGVRLRSSSLRKLTLRNVWSANFVSITAPSLRRFRIDYGMESCEHLEVYASKLKCLEVDGSGVLRLITVQSNRLTTVELRHCSELTPPCFQNFLKDNPTIANLLLGSIAAEEISLEASCCPRLQVLGIQPDFMSRVLSVRCPSLEHLHFAEDSDFPELESVIIIANHLQTISLTGVLSLRCLHIQCDILETLEVNLHSDVILPLRSCVVHSHRVIGTVKFSDCSMEAFSISAPSVGVLVLYRCFVQNYAMQMALIGCSYISHLSLEKCLSLTEFHLPPSLTLRFLNLYGCQRLRLVQIDLPTLSAVNLGQCYKVDVVCDGRKVDVSTNAGFPIIPPRSFIRWNHTEVPIPYQDQS